MDNEKVTSQFATDYNKGFKMSFNNGMTISIQFGTSNYCSRNSARSLPMSEMKEYIVSSPDAEIAIWDADGNWFNFGSDEVKGWCTANEVADWIAAVSTVKDLTELHSIATERQYIGI